MMEKVNRVKEELNDSLQSVKFTIKNIQESIKTLNSQNVQQRDQLGNQDSKVHIKT